MKLYKTDYLGPYLKPGDLFDIGHHRYKIINSTVLRKNELYYNCLYLNTQKSELFLAKAIDNGLINYPDRLKRVFDEIV